MFRYLANQIQASGAGDIGQVFRRHPAELINYLEWAWIIRPQAWNPGDRDYRPELARPGVTQNGAYWPTLRVAAPPPFRHLAYAYFLENTRIVEVMRRVVQEYLAGERLGRPSGATQLWLTNTESLFFRDGDSGWITSITSDIRPDLAATRRSAYYRMFGMDLNHLKDSDGKSVQFTKPQISNREFVKTFEEFLREVSVGIANRDNSSGANPTNPTALANLTRVLREMLVDRRLAGGFQRTEFVSVATLSWFHLTIEWDSPLVVDLNAQATSPAERLKKIAERVGLAASNHTDSYLQLADPMEAILRLIEGTAMTPTSVPALYIGAANPIRDQIERITTYWSIATGRDVREPVTSRVSSVSTATSSTPASPSVGSGSPSLAARTNGSVPVGSTS